MTTLSSISTTRFGEIRFEPEDVVLFEQGLIGFEDQRQYVLIQHREGSPFRWLQSIEEPALAFLVTDPSQFFSDYAPEMPASVAESLHLREETARLVYTIVTIPPGRPEAMTVNLAGPIVINAEERRGRQIVLENEAYAIKHPLTAPSQEDRQAA